MTRYKFFLSIFLLCLLPVTGHCFEPSDFFFESQRAELEQKGLSFEAVYYGDWVNNMQGGLRQKATYLGDLDLGLTYNLGQAGLVPGGKLYVSAHNTHGGENPTEKYIGDLQWADNIEVPDAVRFYEWWYEQTLFQEKFSVLAGVQGLDSEFAITDYGALFIHSSFGTPPELGYNVFTSTFPSVGPAVRIKLKPIESVELLAGIYDGDPTDNGKNRHNLGYRLSSRQGLLNIYEAAVHFGIPVDGKELPGTIKAGTWLHTQDVDHVISTDENGDLIRRSNDYGSYCILDQMLFRETADDDQGLGIFFQFGGAPDDRNTIDYYFGTGLHYKGLIPKRDQDTFGVALANAFLSERLQKNRDTEIEFFDPEVSDPGDKPHERASHESAFEMTYRIQLHEHLAVQPDYQIIFHPGGEDSVKTAHVFILRFEIRF